MPQSTYPQPQYLEPQRYADQHYDLQHYDPQHYDPQQYAAQPYEQSYSVPGYAQPQWGQQTYDQQYLQPQYVQPQPYHHAPVGSKRPWLAVMIAAVVVAVVAVGVALVVVLGDKTAGTAKGKAAAAPPMDPATVVQSYVDAAKANDKSAAKKLVCSSQQENVESNADFSQISQMQITVGEAVVDGQQAKVPITASFQGQSSSVAVGLIKESAQWKICSMTPVEAS